MSSLSFHDKQHILRLLQQQGQVKRIFDEFVRRSGLVLDKWTEKSAGNVWVRNAALEKRIDKLLIDLHDSLLANIDSHTVGAWEAANIKSDDLINAYIKDLALSEIVGKSSYNELEKGMFARNMEALKAFRQRKIDGFTVSDRVWKAVDGAKENLEYYLSSGISTGRSAASIAVDIRQLLQDPERRFRRVRNDDGKLVLSKPMQDYHPGQGVYRSSYKNALRVAATETNMAYHSADHERWKNQGFVLGIEVSRSRSNKGACDICDPMVGRYPKDFKFATWHPFCICVAVPVMLEGEEFIDYLLTGKVPEDKFIKTIPQSALDFVNAKEANRNNLFVKENSKFFAGDVNAAGKVSTNVPQPSRERIKELRTWAKENLIDKVVHHPDFIEGIRFTNTGIKEFLNQPHKEFSTKNDMLKEIGTLISNSKVVSESPDVKGNPNNHYYYLETLIGKHYSYIVIKLTRHNNQYTLYSIVDKIKNR